MKLSTHKTMQRLQILQTKIKLTRSYRISLVCKGTMIYELVVENVAVCGFKKSLNYIFKYSKFLLKIFVSSKWNYLHEYWNKFNAIFSHIFPGLKKLLKTLSHP